ncbi:MAG: gliding motility-associated C-terminal domain-containing protein [Bacteroidales bacterium]|jgi:gliding motility-associated-like protein|nr:gliding motility-associated C-terminal domain-containing protein [Bacteroidales bacterium]
MLKKYFNVLLSVVTISLQTAAIAQGVYNIQIKHLYPDGPFCGFDQDAILEMYVVGATGAVAWTVPPALGNGFPSGTHGDTLLLIIDQDATTDFVTATISGPGGGTASKEIILCKKADQPGVITQVPPSSFVCEGNSNTFSVPADLNDYGIMLQRYWEVLSANSQPMIVPVTLPETTRTLTPALNYSSDSINPVGGVIKITPFTCEGGGGRHSQATPQVYNINKFVRKKLFTDSFLSNRNTAIEPITRIPANVPMNIPAYWKKISLINPEKALNACTYYSDMFNVDDNAIREQDPDSEEDLSMGFGDGYLHLQIGNKHGNVYNDHKPDTTWGEDMFHYEWIFDPLQLEQQTTYTTQWTDNEFGENSYRTRFKVLENGGAADHDITVKVKVTCQPCRTKNGITDPSDSSFVQVFSRIFKRVDSVKNYDEYNLVKPFQTYCAGQEAKFSIDVPSEPNFKAAEVKEFLVDVPRYWENFQDDITCILPPPSMCFSIKTGANPSNLGNSPGDTVPVFVRPVNGCYKNNGDTSRNGKAFLVYLKNRPIKPQLYDTILKVQYDPEFTPPPPSSTDKQIFPILMCNTNINALNIFKIRNVGDYIERHRVIDNFYGHGELWIDDESPRIEWIDKETSIFMPNFKPANLAAHANQRVAIGFYAENECGAGDTGMYYINVIDTLSMNNSPILNSVTSDTNYKDILCEGEQIELTNTISNSYTPIDVSPGVKDKVDQSNVNTDRVELVWNAPDGWTFLPESATGEYVTAEAGYASGSVEVRIRNKCGVGQPVSSKHITVHPYTRTKIQSDTAPCQGSIVTYMVDTVAETVGYEWRLPDDWKFVDNGMNILYTTNAEGPGMPHDVIVGADSGYIYVVGKKDTSYHCNFDYDNYSFHRRDSLRVKPRLYTEAPIPVGTWNDTLCARDILSLVVEPDSAYPKDLVYFTWIFPNDGLWLNPDFSAKGDTLRSIEVANTSHYKGVIKVVAGRIDCNQNNIGDTLYYDFIVMDTIAPKGEVKDLDVHPCEGDTVYYVLNQKQDTTVYNLEWFWNGRDTTLSATTDSIDFSGWRLHQNSDTLALIVGADTLEVGYRTRSYCGTSSLHTLQIIPTQHIRQKPNISVFDSVFCNGEQRIFEIDSVPFATDFVWYFPFGTGIDTAKRTYTFYEDKYDTGYVYVLAYNRCETGLYSDTVRIMDTLSPPSAVLLPGYTIINDSVFDTVCLRSDVDYRAYLNDTAYGIRYEWSLLAGTATLTPQDTLCTYSKSSGFDRSVVAVAARHKFCTKYGDSVFIVVAPFDTAIVPDGQQLRDYIFEQETAQPIAFLSPCARDTVYYYFNKALLGQKVDTTFFLWNGGNIVNPADSTMAGTTFKLLGAVYSDNLIMKVGVLDSIKLSVQTHNRCGYSILKEVKITAGEALPLTSQQIFSSSPYFCQRDSMIIEVPTLNMEEEYEWHFPWMPYTDTAKNIRVFAGIDFVGGDVYAYPFNGCGKGISSDTIKIEADSILDAPSRVIPSNFAAGQIGATVWDTLCVGNTLALNVTRNPLDTDIDSLVFVWELVEGKRSNFTSIDSICNITQNDLHDTAFVLNVYARREKCTQFGDTLQVKIFQMDVLTFAGARNDTFFEILLDSTLVYENISEKFPQDIALCGGDTVLYRTGTPSAYHWSANSVWMNYPLDANTSWDYIVAGIDTLYAIVSNDTFAFSVSVENYCGTTVSDYITIRPSQTIIDTPVIIHGSFCLDDDDSTFFAISDSIENATEYVWDFPWDHYSVTTSLINRQPSDSLRDGKVTVYARNGCGTGPVSDTLEIKNIRHKPQRPEPTWYSGLNVINDTVIDSICLYTGGFLLSVKGDTNLVYQWSVTLPNIDIVGVADSIATVEPAISAVAGDMGEIKVTSRWEDCSTFGDTLTIRLKIVDTAAALSITSIIVYPDDYRYCPDEVYTLTVANPEISPAYKWFLPVGWYFDTTFIQDTTGYKVVVVAADYNGGYVSVAPITDSLSRICNYYSANPKQTDDSFAIHPYIINRGFWDPSEKTPCAGTTVVYSVNPIAEALGYYWEFPRTWQIVNTTDSTLMWGTSSCEVIVGSESGYIRVRAIDTCNSGLYLYSPEDEASILHVEPIDTARVRVSGNNFVCVDSAVVLTISMNSHTSYYLLDVISSNPPENCEATPTSDSTLRIVNHNIDTLTLIFIAINKSSNCEGYYTTDTHYIISGSVPTIKGEIEGDTSVCYLTEHTYSAIIDTSENYGDITYRWVLPYRWIAVGRTDTSVITVMTPSSGDTVKLECYPSAMCGEVQDPFTLWITLNAQDTINDYLTISDTNPCVNTEIDISLNEYYHPDTYSFFWVYPSIWDSSNVRINPPSIHLDIHSAGEQTVGVYYRRLGACGNSLPLTGTISVRDSASAAVIEDPHPCMYDLIFPLVLEPNSNIDSAVWTIFASDTNIFDRPASAIRNDSATIKNPSAGSVSAPITVNITTFNSCYPKDTTIMVQAVGVANNFSNTVSVNHFCISDTGFAYIALDTNHYRNAIVYTWHIQGDSSWHILGKYTDFTDSFNYVEFISGDDTSAVTLMLTGKNSCGNIDTVYTAIKPYSFSVFGSANPDNVLYGEDSVVLSVVSVFSVASVNPLPLSAYDFSWHVTPQWRIFTDTSTNVTYTRTLVREVEEFLLIAKEKPLLSDSVLPLYMRSSCCTAADTVQVFVDSTFIMISDTFLENCLDEQVTLTMYTYGGNTQKYSYSWYMEDENGDYILDLSLISSQETIVTVGDTIRLMIVGCDDITIYDVDFSDSLNVSKCDTQYVTILVNYVDVEIIRPKREPEVPFGTAVNIEVLGYGGRGGYSYHWSSSPDDVMSSKDTLSAKNKTRVLFRDEQVRVVVRDTVTGCVIDTVLSIRMNNEFNENLPNGFSPNGDGINDIFMKDVDLLIFNRWGQQIFASTNKEGWDGTYKGKPVAKGEYLYIITIENDGEKIVQKGVVTVF